MRRRYDVLTALAAGVGVAAGFWGGGSETAAGKALEGLGGAIRALSLSGGAGNALAWAIFIVLGALPLLGLLPAGRKRTGADALWLLSGVYAWFMLYMLVNPHLMRGWLCPAWAEDGEIGALLLLGGFLTLLLAAFFLRIARGEEKRLFDRLHALLVIFECLAAFAWGASLPDVLRSEGADLAYAVIERLCAMALAGFFVMLCRSARALAGGLKAGWLRDENAALADRLAAWARRMLTAELIAMAVENGAALALGARLTNISVDVSVPLGSLLISLAGLLLARFVSEGIRVRSENDGFI